MRGVILVQNICKHVNFQLRFASPYGIFLSSPFKFSYKLPWFLECLFAGSEGWTTCNQFLFLETSISFN